MRDLSRGNTLRVYNPYPHFIYLGSVVYDVMPKHTWPSKHRWKSMKSLERKKFVLSGFCLVYVVSF